MGRKATIQRGPLTEEQRALAAANVRLVSYAINRFARVQVGSTHHAALRSELKLSLCRSALTYDPAVGRFSTYAMWLMRRTIRRYLAAANTHKRRAEWEEVSWSALVTPDGKALPDPEDTRELESCRGVEIRDLLDHCRRLVTPREWEVLVRRLQYDEGLHEIADVLGISRERVRQIEAAAMVKIRKRYPQGYEVVKED